MVDDNMFLASNTLLEHLLRGIVGIGALVAALNIADAHPLLAFALAVLTLIAFRGCPVCWSIGLLATLWNRFKQP